MSHTYGSKERMRLPIGPLRAMLRAQAERHGQQWVLDRFEATGRYACRDSADRAMRRMLFESSTAVAIDVVDAVCLEIDGPGLLDELYPLAEFRTLPQHRWKRGKQRQDRGECSGCGKDGALKARGLCRRCYYATRREIEMEAA